MSYFLCDLLFVMMYGLLGFGGFGAISHFGGGQGGGENILFALILLINFTP